MISIFLVSIIAAVTSGVTIGRQGDLLVNTVTIYNNLHSYQSVPLDF